MEKSTPKKTKKTVSAEDLKQSFMEYVLLEGKLPSSVFAFARHNKMKESEFYDHYNSFQSLEKAIWTDWLKETLVILQQDENFDTFSSREKMLSFFFTWFEQLKENRSYVMMKWEGANKDFSPSFLSGVRSEWIEFVKDVISSGKSSGEIAERPFTGHYEKAFWLQFLFLMRFWSKDDSSSFESTDEAIEKSVNLGFDLIGSGPLETMIDFAKFLYQKGKSFS